MGFEPFYLSTDDVGQALKKFADERKLGSASVDFELLSTHTLVRRHPDEDFAEVTPEELAVLLQPQALLDPGLAFKQMHEVRIVPPVSRGWRLVGQVAADRHLAKVRLIAKKESVFPSGADFTEAMVREINRRKARLGLLVGVCDAAMHAGIRELEQKLEGRSRLESDFEMVMCQGVEPRATRNDDLIPVYKIRQEEYIEQNSHAHDRGFAYAVVAGEVVLEYLKPRRGEPGRSCKGEYIPAYEPSVTKKPTFKVGASITVEETEDATLYKAAQSGYVQYTDSALEITDTMQVQELSFRKTGSVALRLESDTKLDIKQGDITEDSIGDGVFVEVAELKVAGSVGPDAVIKAKTVSIGGQTHQKSHVTAEIATIVSHRGLLECHDATIQRLEGGRVDASGHVMMTEMGGGEVAAESITVDTLHSNSTLIAYKTIEIKNLAGQNNKLIVRPGGGDNKRLAELEQQRKEIVGSLTMAKKDLARLHTLFAPYKHRYMELKDLVEKAKPGMLTPATMTEYKALRARVAEIKNLRDRIEAEDLKLIRINEMIEGFDNVVEEVKIKARSVWKGYNEIIFELSSPPVTLTYIPKDGERTNTIMLVKNHEGDFEIETIG